MKPEWEYATSKPDLDTEPAPPAGEGWERDPAVSCPSCEGCGFILDDADRRGICSTRHSRRQRHGSLFRFLGQRMAVGSTKR
jgi:hypothetical protein